MWPVFGVSRIRGCTEVRGLLSAYIDRKLDAARAALVENHIGACPECAEQLGSLRATVALLRTLPEAMPARTFAVAPPRALPGRAMVPALRLATAGAVVVLAVVFAVDQADWFEPRSGNDLGFATSSAPGTDACWVADGLLHADSESTIPVELIVPDHTGDVYSALDPLTNDGTVYASVDDAAGTPRLVLEGDEEDAAASGAAEEFRVFVKDSNEADRTPSAAAYYDSSEPLLNAASMSGDNAVYTFDLSTSRKLTTETGPAPGHDWWRVAEYGLIGLAAVLGVATLAAWIRRRRALSS